MYFFKFSTTLIVSAICLGVIAIEWVAMESPVVWTGSAKVLDAEQYDRGVRLKMQRLDGSDKIFYIDHREFTTIWLESRGKQTYTNCIARNNGIGNCVPSSMSTTMEK